MSGQEADRTSQVLSHNDAAVLKHIDMYQATIVRFSNYSVFCKLFSLILIAILLVILIKEDNYHVVWVSVFIIFGFYMLDSYFLSLERNFRNVFISCARRISDGRFEKRELFIIRPHGSFWQFYLQSVTSFSLWPFYMFMFMMVTLISQINF